MKTIGLAFALFIGVCLAGVVIGVWPDSTYTRLAAQPAVVAVCLDDSLAPYTEEWKVETARRFSNAVVVFGHGGELPNGHWCVLTADGPVAIATIVEQYRLEYPNRTMVLMICNPAHLTLGISGVYYFMSSVWCTPDRDLIHQNDKCKFDLLDDLISQAKPTLSRSQTDPDVAGNIFEAVCE